MKITIDTEVLKREHLTMGEFLVMLIGYYDVKYKDMLDKLVDRDIVNRSVFDKNDMVLSNNTKNLTAKIVLESDDKANSLGIDYEALAKKLQEIYPSGVKPGTTYYWRGDTSVIVQRLRALVVKYDFTFTEEEAIKATKEYVNSFKDNETKQMSLLGFFIFRTNRTDGGDREINSMFMTIIENNR